MTIARCRQVSVETTPYYHVIGRCVRRAFLCGFDSNSGKYFEHRRQWVIERLELLCSVFAVELCSYAIMSNHYHLVVRLAPHHVESWTDEEVMTRWEKLKCHEQTGTFCQVTFGTSPTDATEAPSWECSSVQQPRTNNLWQLSPFAGYSRHRLPHSIS